MPYEIASYDVCCSGNERLRSYSEFILVAPIRAESTLDELLESLNDDLRSCMREDHFDYDEAKRILTELRESLAPLFAKSNPFDLEPTPDSDDIDTSDDWPNFYLFVRDTDESHIFPVFNL